MLPAYVEINGLVKKDIEAFESIDGIFVNDLKKRINRISVLLRILETKEASEELKVNLQLFRDHFESTYSNVLGGKKTYDMIDNSRNSLLHGERYWQKLYGALINLICVLINSNISMEMYDSKYKDVIDFIDWNNLYGKRRFSRILSTIIVLQR